MTDSGPRKSEEGELPNVSEDIWYAMSVAMVIIATSLAPFVLGWVISASDVASMKLRVDVAAPFAAFFLALVTFSTVAWRGMVTSRQADQQKRQNDANDEANYSKLLQEAAKLLADAEKRSQVIAGIASLEILISEPKRRFAIEAMDLLGDHLLTTYHGGSFDRVSRAVIRGLSLGENLGLISRVDGVFTSPEKYASWQYLPAFRSINLTGGSLSEEVYEKSKNRIKALTNVRISGGEYARNISYQRCSFLGSRITEIQEFRLALHNFNACDFSDAVIRQLSTVEAGEYDLRAGGNYFREGHPPVDGNGNSIADKFLTFAEYSQWQEEGPF